MTPEQMAELLTAWAHNVYPYDRRVDCVEPDGPRRTWILSEGSRQVGHARGRQGPGGEWTWEAANAGLDVLRAAR